MNLDNIKNDIAKHLNSNVIVTVYGMRNRVDKYDGYIKSIYPNFFTIMYRNDEKSFNYRDIVTKDIKIKYL